MDYDLLLKDGHVIDPQNEIDELRDIAIKNGKTSHPTQRRYRGSTS